MKIEIYEEALASLIKRVEALEQGNTQKTIYTPSTLNLATQNQLKYIDSLGGQTWHEMTKQEAGIEIDRLVTEKTPKEKPEPLGKSPVETMQSKPLTPEQIEELGDALL